MPKKIKIEFWSGYPGGRPLLYDKDTRENVDKLIYEYGQKAKDLMEETSADHVLYAIEHIGLMKRVCFYTQPMTDEQFHTHFAYQGKRMIYAVHNPATGADKSSDADKNDVDDKPEDEAADVKDVNDKKSSKPDDDFWQMDLKIEMPEQESAEQEAAEGEADKAEEGKEPSEPKKR